MDIQYVTEKLKDNMVIVMGLIRTDKDLKNNNKYYLENLNSDITNIRFDSPMEIRFHDFEKILMEHSFNKSEYNGMQIIVREADISARKKGYKNYIFVGVKTYKRDVEANGRQYVSNEDNIFSIKIEEKEILNYLGSEIWGFGKKKYKIDCTIGKVERKTIERIEANEGNLGIGDQIIKREIDKLNFG